MPTSSCLPARHRRNSRSVPSSVNPEYLLVHVHAGGEHRVVEGKLDGQPDGGDHGLNLLESSNHST